MAKTKKSSNKRQLEEADGAPTAPVAKKAKQFDKKPFKAASSTPKQSVPSSSAKSSDGGLVKQCGTDDTMWYWELPNTNLKRATISKFKGNLMVNFRSYYEKDGKTLPGKQGINMPVDQYKTLLKAIPLINAELRAMGEDVHEALPAVLTLYSGDASEDDDGGEDEVEQPKSTKKAAKKAAKKDKKPKKSKKANIEATSDEEDEASEKEESSSEEEEDWETPKRRLPW